MDSVYVSLEMITSAKTFATLLTLIWPLSSVCPQMLSIILLGEELLPTLLAPVQLLYKNAQNSFHILLVGFDLKMNTLPVINKS